MYSQKRIFILRNDRDDDKYLLDILKEEFYESNIIFSDNLSEITDDLNVLIIESSYLDNKCDSRFMDIRKKTELPIIIITSAIQSENALEFIKEGAQDVVIRDECFCKNFNLSVKFSMERNRLFKKLENARNSLEISDRLRKEALEKLNKEIELARKVQGKLLPGDFSKFPAVKISSAYLPSARISGDLYDVQKPYDDVYVFYIIDVAGHGLPAALMTAVAKLTFLQKFKISHRDCSLDKCLKLINRDIYEVMDTGAYLTSFIGVLDLKDSKFYYSQMGHPPAILFNSSTKKLKLLETNNPPLGFIKEPDIKVGEVKLEKNDRVLFYTDGVTETEDDNGVAFGEERLKNILSRDIEDLDNLIWEIIDELTEHCKDGTRTDDVTMMGFEYL